jgi:hypothetical protein
MTIHLNNIETSFSFVLLFIFIILFLINSIILIVKSKKENNSKDVILGWVEKKDILYWLIIISLGAISVITYEYSGDRDALSHWSFAGTIVSIILAIVAIGFTLFQTFTNNLSSEKIAGAADKIQKASDGLDSSELNKAGKIISGLSSNILSINEKLEKEMFEINNEIKSLKEEQTNYYAQFNDIFSLKKNTSTDSDSLNVELSKEEFLNKIISQMPYMHIFFLYCIFRFKNEGIHLTNESKVKFLEEYGQEFVKRISNKGGDKRKIGFVKGANHASWSSVSTYLSFFGLKITEESIEMSDAMHSAIKEIAPHIIKNDDLEFLNNYLQTLKENN